MTTAQAAPEAVLRHRRRSGRLDAALLYREGKAAFCASSTPRGLAIQQI
jgi:hypothetical protein